MGADAGRDWGQEEKGTTEDEMAGWHHRLNGHGFGWTLGTSVPPLGEKGKLKQISIGKVRLELSHQQAFGFPAHE